jgi:hypothetical protein
MLRHTQLWLSSIAVAALMASAGAQTLGTRPQTAAEILVTYPQPHRSCWGRDPLTAITGNLNAPAMWICTRLLICDPLMLSGRGQPWRRRLSDTQLWLFDLRRQRPAGTTTTDLPLWRSLDRDLISLYIGPGAAPYRLLPGLVKCYKRRYWSGGSQSWGLPGPGIVLYRRQPPTTAIHAIRAAANVVYRNDSPFSGI